MSTNLSQPSTTRSMTNNKLALRHLKTRRKYWLKVHLWLGLSVGLILAVIGLSGSALVFWQELDRALNPALYRTGEQSPASSSLDQIIAAGTQAAPPGWDSAWVLIPDEADGNYLFGFYYPQTSPPPEQAQSLNIAVDPHSGSAVGKRVFYHGWNPLKHCLVGFLFKLHYALFLGSTGVILVGILAVLFTVSTLSGLILWWPLTGKWRRVLTIKRRASAERFNHDLHQSAGFYSALVLLAVLISGIYFNLPDQFRWLVEVFSPLTPSPALAAESAPNPTANLEIALQQARLAYPGGSLHNFDFNQDKLGLFTACYKDVPELRPYIVADRCLVISRASGELLQIKDAEHGSGGDLFMQWQWPLHSGQAFGWTGRILVFLAGLVCPLLFITGLIRWLQKRRARQQTLARL